MFSPFVKAAKRQQAGRQATSSITSLPSDATECVEVCVLLVGAVGVVVPLSTLSPLGERYLNPFCYLRFS